MAGTRSIICGTALRNVLRQAAVESAQETERYCAAVSTVGRGVADAHHEEALAWIAARVTQQAWDLLPAQEVDAMAPIAWAIQEIIEWASHLRRLERLGELECRTPITWLPAGADHPLGTPDLCAAVEERLDLLRQELSEHGVSIDAPEGTGVAA